MLDVHACKGLVARGVSENNITEYTNKCSIVVACHQRPNGLTRNLDHHQDGGERTWSLEVPLDYIGTRGLGLLCDLGQAEMEAGKFANFRPIMVLTALSACDPRAFATRLWQR